jgi:uncharacterized membrane protein
MLRQHATSVKRKSKDRIEWRNHEVLRIEAFSDAVFAFAITLLIVSLEVPKSFHELVENLKGFIPFAICFTLIFQVWYTQNIFFRRFGLHDYWTVILNAMLIFTVLFFVYPLKFLYTALITTTVNITVKEFQQLFYIYSGGFAIIYFLFAIMYWHAFRNNHEHIGLTQTEIFEAKTECYQQLIMVFVALCSILLATIGGRMLMLAGFIYVMIGPLIAILHSRRAKIRNREFGTAMESS